MDDATGLAEALLGLDGFAVLAVEETPSEVVVTVETTADFVGCPTCGVRAEAKDRLRVDIGTCPVSDVRPGWCGQAALALWGSRLCGQDVDRGHRACRPRAVLTLRAGAEATRQVGELALPVAVVARELGVCWWTVMDAVVLHGTPLVEDPSGSRRSGPWVSTKPRSSRGQGSTGPST